MFSDKLGIFGHQKDIEEVNNKSNEGDKDIVASKNKKDDKKLDDTSKGDGSRIHSMNQVWDILTTGISDAPSGNTFNDRDIIDNMIEESLLRGAVIIMRKCDISMIFPSQDSISNNVKKKEKNNIEPDCMKVRTLSDNSDNASGGDGRKEPDKIVEHDT